MSEQRAPWLVLACICIICTATLCHATCSFKEMEEVAQVKVLWVLQQSGGWHVLTLGPKCHWIPDGGCVQWNLDLGQRSRIFSPGDWNSPQCNFPEEIAF